MRADACKASGTAPAEAAQTSKRSRHRLFRLFHRVQGGLLQCVLRFSKQGWQPTVVGRATAQEGERKTPRCFSALPSLPQANMAASARPLPPRRACTEVKSQTKSSSPILARNNQDDNNKIKQVAGAFACADWQRQRAKPQTSSLTRPNASPAPPCNYTLE